MPRFGRHNKDTYSWAPENSRTNTELEFWRTRSGENIPTAQTTSVNAPYQRLAQSVNKQHVLLMSVYFTHSGYADHNVEKMYRSIEKLTNFKKKNIQIVGGDFNAELGPGYGERRLDEAMADVTKLHSTQHDVQKKRLKSTYRTPNGTEKQFGLHIGGQETYLLQQSL